MVTTNGKFWMNWQHRNENVSKTVDTLDEAVETYNMVCLKHGEDAHHHRAAPSRRRGDAAEAGADGRGKGKVDDVR